MKLFIEIASIAFAILWGIAWGIEEAIERYVIKRSSCLDIKRSLFIDRIISMA